MDTLQRSPKLLQDKPEGDAQLHRSSHVNKKDVLIRRLIESSRSQKLSWKTSFDTGAYEVGFPQYAIQISLGSRFNKMDLVLRILNESGNVLEEILDTEMAEDTGSFYFETMYELYVLARRSTVGADKAIDSLLLYLD